MSFTKEQVAELKKKLNPDAVQPAQKFGPKGDYIEGWHAIAEANRIFGFDGWSYEIVKLECVFQGERAIGRNKEPGFGVTYVAHIKTQIGGTVREDVGSGHGYDKDCGLAHESASKEAITDALKRCLRTYGNPFGLALYDKTHANVGVDIDWAQERDELTRIIKGCENLDDLLELWKTDRLKNFIHNAPQEFSSPVIQIKDRQKETIQQLSEAT